MPGHLHERWSGLVEAIKQECANHGQLPGGGVLGVNGPRFMVSLPLNAEERWSRTFDKSEILDGNLKQLASSFYASYLAQKKEG